MYVSERYKQIFIYLNLIWLLKLSWTQWSQFTETSFTLLPVPFTLSVYDLTILCL